MNLKPQIDHFVEEPEQGLSRSSNQLEKPNQTTVTPTTKKET